MTRETCRACGNSELLPLFSLGEQFVSDFVNRRAVLSGPRVPIDIVQCTECTLVQQKHTAPQDFMYTRHYWYRSGVTDTMKAALNTVASVGAQYLRSGDAALDIGSNDGTFLRALKQLRPGVTAVGVEPANNLVEEGRRGVDLLIHDFWSYGALQSAGLRKFKLITALGMFYDLEDPNQFIRDVSLALDDDGVFVAQLMCAKNMLDTGDVGNLCHEHLEFYTLRSLALLFAKYDLEVFDVQENNVNGRSFRIQVGRPGRHRHTTRLSAALAADADLWSAKPWEAFYRNACEQRDRCVEHIDKLNTAGARVWVYGASTKGNVILQWYGLDHSRIEGAADRSPEKCGKFTVGTGIPIHAEEFARPRATHFLVLPYAFLSEFLRREAEWVRAGGKFLVPLPTFRVVP